MSKIKFYICIGVVVVTVCLFLCHFKLIGLQEQARRQFSEIDNTTDRRNDYIPELVKIAEASSEKERQTLLAYVNQLKELSLIKSSGADLGKAETLEQIQQAQDRFGSVYSKLRAALYLVAPKVQSSKNYQFLMAELAGSQNRIYQARRLYNEKATGFNTALRILFIFDGYRDFKRMALFKMKKGGEKLDIQFSK